MSLHKLLFLISILLLLAVPARPAPMRCNAQDSLALVALYNSTNGANWTLKNNWLTTYVCEWQGVKVVNNRVTEINLPSNNLTGTLPTEIGNLTNLTSLKLTSNAITGSIPREISKASSLSILVLAGNKLAGAIPAEMGQMGSLTDLELHSNSLNGAIPPELGKLYNLTILYLHNNQLTGKIPSELGDLFNLQKLYLNSNSLSGAIPVELGKLTNLQMLILNNNNLSGSIPSSLGSLTKLTYLYLYYNKLSGAIPDELGNLTNLYYLYLYNNALTGEIPKTLGNAINLRQIYLQVNQLQGAIPAELGQLKYLQILNLSVNQLNGVLPETIVDLTSLNILDVSTNQLSGAIPAEVGKLTKLTDLVLDRNQFSGAIPASLNRLTNIKNLTLTSNKFSAFLADSLYLLQNINTISVYCNNLTFEDLEDKTNLFNLYFYYNPQNTIGQQMLVSVDSGATYTLTVSCGGSQNRYQWYFNEAPIGTVSESPNLILTDIRQANTGAYYCKITNSLVPKLTLRSEPILIQFSPQGEYPPTNLMLSNGSLDENLPAGTEVGKFSTEDADNDESHFYSLVNGEGSSGNSSFFIAANELHTSMAFDFEKQNSYSIRVQTKDETNKTFEKIFIISINDIIEWTPDDIQLSNNRVDELLPAGTVVGTFSTLSRDSILNENFIYTLINNDNPDNNDNFYISGNELRTLRSFDYNIQSSFEIRVISSNSVGDTVSKNFTIQINDVPDQLPNDILLSSNTINENFPIGTYIGTFSTQGIDHSQVTDFTYTLVEGEGSSDNHSFFIAVNQLHSNQEFNFEEKSGYSIRVQSEDLNGFTVQKQFTISVIDLNDTHDITIPDAFSPNGDGKNDFLQTPGAENYSSVVIDIYNRYGKLVYHHDHYGLPDDTGAPVYWDGRLSANGSSSNKVLPEGYYFVVLKIDQNTIYKKTVFLKQ